MTQQESNSPITTRLAPAYGWRMLFMAVLCAVFGIWGAYDYWVTIPAEEQKFEEFEQLKATLSELEERAKSRPLQTMTPDDAARAQEVTARINELAPGGEPPLRPSKFNRATQWVYIACFPFTFYCLWIYQRAKKQAYRLDEHNALHFTGDPKLGSGVWTKPEIVDIDMSRWMAKSVAHLVHANGTRLMLDAYLHTNLDVIVGRIAARLHPDAWTADAKPVKGGAESIANPEPAANATAAATAGDESRG